MSNKANEVNEVNEVIKFFSLLTEKELIECMDNIFIIQEKGEIGSCLLKDLQEKIKNLFKGVISIDIVIKGILFEISKRWYNNKQQLLKKRKDFYGF
jgi:hypothetical protein